ncbi:hypothetical protein ABT317_51770, partial [Streptomyces carpinensis]
MRTTARPSRRSVLLGIAGAGAATMLGAAPSWAVSDDTVTVTAIPSAESERLRLAAALRGSEF